MRLSAVTCDGGKTIALPAPFSLTIHRDLEAPADDLVLSFPCLENMPQLSRISVLCESGETIFHGVVDEQEFQCTSKGCVLEVSARSLAALLLDNEALPQVYYLPSLTTIFEKHAVPYGFSRFLGDKTVFPERFSVAKGMSEWEVLKTFCEEYLHTIPRVTVDGLVDATTLKSAKGQCLLLNNKPGGLCFSSVRFQMRPYKVISEVFIRTKENSHYDLSIKNKDAISRGIVRKRYLNVAEDERVSTAKASEIIRRGQWDFRTVTVGCPYFAALDLGQRVSLEHPLLPDFGELIVSKIKYTFNASGEQSELSLQWEDS